MENSLTRRKALGLTMASVIAPSMITRANAVSSSPVLVELFTSQGCSSCPAADRLAADLIDKPGVTVVSFNVDYWDYLGWNDTLAKPEFTKRQMDYAHSRGDMDVYTPQMVLNGATHVVGSNRSAVGNGIAAAQATVMSVELQIIAKNDVIDVEIPKSEIDGEATLWLLAVAPSVTVKIERGENAGSTIKYHNVVRNLVNAGLWKGGEQKFTFKKPELMPPDCKTCIAVLQKGTLGPILGMATFKS